MSNPFFDNQDEILEAFQGKAPEDKEATQAKWEEHKSRLVPGAKVRYKSAPGIVGVDFLVGKIGTIVNLGPSPIPFGDKDSAAVAYAEYPKTGPFWLGVKRLDLVDEQPPANEAKKDLPKGQKEAEFAEEIDKNYKGPTPEELRVKKILDPIRKDIIAYLKKHPINYYLDYTDKLQKEDIEAIVEEDLEKGYYKISDKAHENGLDWQGDQEDDLLKEMAKEFGLEEPDYDPDAEDDGNFIELDVLRDEFRDYMEYGEGVVEQLLKRTDAQVAITIVGTMDWMGMQPQGVGIGSDIKDVLRFFKSIINITGGSVSAKDLYEEFIKTPQDEDRLYDGIVIYGKVDLDDVVEYKRNPDTKFLTISGGKVGLRDSGGDYGNDGAIEMTSDPITVRNIVDVTVGEYNTKKIKSKTVYMDMDKTYEPDASISLTPVKLIRGFSLQAKKEALKLPLYMNKIAKWFKKIEQEEGEKAATEEKARMERTIYVGNRDRIEKAAEDIVTAKPWEHWATLRGKAGEGYDLVTDHNDAGISELEKKFADLKIGRDWFTQVFDRAVSAYHGIMARKAAAEEKKKKHREAYDAAQKKPTAFRGKSWEDMYPEDAEKVPATEALAGKSEDDKQDTVDKKKAAYQEFLRKLEEVSITILQPSLGPKKQDSFWYNGDIAVMTWKDRKVIVHAGGDVRCYFPKSNEPDTLFSDADARGKARELGYTDKDLWGGNKVGWENNNWFDLGFFKNDEYDFSTDNVQDNYDSAIEYGKSTIVDDDYDSYLTENKVKEAAEDVPFHLTGKSEEDKEATAAEIKRAQDEAEAATEEWVRVARRELEAELACHIRLSETDEVEYGRCRMERVAGQSNNGESSWMVFKDQAVADDFGLSYVEEQIEQIRLLRLFRTEPGNFNQDFILNHISISDMDKRLIADEEAEAYVAGLDDADLLEESGGETDLDAARDIIKDKRYDDVKKSLEDPIEYFVHELGSHSVDSLLKSPFIHIDARAAAEEAIGSDGLAHFLDPYDGEEITLPSGAIAFGGG